MPTYEPKSINNKSRESISKSGRSYLSLDGNTVHNISKNSGVADRWIPSNQDELDDFIDIISPIGKEVDDYIKMGYGSSANPNNYDGHYQEWLNQNPNATANEGKYYDSEQPDKRYADNQGSYTTNEIAINWNAALVAFSAALQTLQEN